VLRDRVIPAAVGLLVFGLASAGCDRAPGPESAPAAPAAELSPRAAIQRLIAARASATYGALRELVVPGRGHEVVKTVMAVDEFLHANAALCDYVRSEFALGLAESIDQSDWGANLDIFSPRVELVDEQITGDTASVAFMVDGRLPLKHARLLRVEGRWCYDPGPGYDPQLPAAFERMARGLRQLLEDLKAGRVAADEIRAEPARLVEEVRVRLLPGIRMLPIASRPAAGSD